MILDIFTSHVTETANEAGDMIYSVACVVVLVAVIVWWLIERKKPIDGDLK